MTEIIGEEPMDEAHRQRGEILLFVLGRLITTQSAAEQLAALSLETNNIELTWATILDAARKSEDRHLETLVDLLVDMASLPPALDDHGEQLMLYNMAIWGELGDLVLVHLVTGGRTQMIYRLLDGNSITSGTVSQTLKLCESSMLI